MPQPTKAKARSKAEPAGPRSADSKQDSPAARNPGGGATGGDAIALLKADHRAVRALFKEFEAADGDAEKRRLAIAICTALKIHDRLEQDILYPAAFAAIEDADLISEALVEHASARDLIAQIESGAPGEALFDARVKVLSEYIEHHVAEEEGEIFPQCKSSGIDLHALGELLAVRKQELSIGFTVSNPVLALD
jgi:hypothetical protein